MAKITDYASKTASTGTSYLYARSVGGDDNNSGKTYATAKATLEGVCAAIPDYIDSPLVVYLDGTFTANSTTAYVQTVLNDSVRFQGYNGYENVAGPWTADQGAADYIGVAAAPFVAGAYRGRILHVMSGAEQGYYTIADNTTQNIYPCKHFSGDPGAVQFQIVQLADVITGTAHNLAIQCSGQSPVILHNLRLEGTSSDVTVGGNQLITLFCEFKNTHRLRIASSPNVILQDSLFMGGELLIEHAAGFLMDRCYVGNVFRLGPHVTTFYGITNGSQIGSILVAQGINQDHAGIGSTKLLESPAGYFKTTCREGVYIKKSVVTLNNTDFDGSSNHGIAIADSLVTIGGTTNISNATSNGIFVEDSSALTVVGSLDISDSGGNGIKLFRSSLLANAVTALTGSGNGGFGLVGQNHSYCAIKNGSPPTLTGTVGDISTDGTTEDATWAEIDAGLKLHIAGELKAEEV